MASIRKLVLPQVSSSATSEAQRAIFKRMDSDGNGYLSFEEFIECMLTLTKKAQQYNIVKTSGAQMPQFSSTSESDMEVDAEVGGEGADAEASNSASEEEDSESDGDEVRRLLLRRVKMSVRRCRTVLELAKLLLSDGRAETLLSFYTNWAP